MAHVDNLRRHFPALRLGTFLDTGSYGLLPDKAVEAMQSVLAWQLEEGRRRDNYLTRLQDVQMRVREQLGNLLHAKARNFALTDSTTAAINLALSGLSLQSGDEVIVTDVEHSSGLLPAYLQKQRRGVSVRVVKGDVSGEDLCRRLEGAIHSRTRLIVVSQVSYATGQRLPVEEIVRLAHRHHVMVLVDGAQGVGAEQLDLQECDVDFYALSGQKWLCGPDGVGALYVKDELLSLIEPSVAGSAMLHHAQSYNLTGGFLLADDAARLEHVQVNLANWIGFLESLQFLRVDVGLDYAYSRIHGLSGYLMEQLLSFDHARLITPRDARAGLVQFRLQNIPAEKFAQACKTRSIYIQTIPRLQAIRVSAGFYNTEDEVDRLVQLVRNPSEL